MFRNIRTIINEERGNILVTSLMLVFAASIIGTTVAMLSSTELKISGNQQLSTEAFFAAEAGLTEAVHRLSLTNPTNVDVGGSTINAALGDKRPYDPNWKTYLMSTTPGADPVVKGSTVYAGTIQDLSGDYLEYSSSNGTADAIVIEHKWVDRNNDGVRDANEIVLYDPKQSPPENFDEGVPVDIVTVTGRSGATRRALQAEVSRIKITAKAMGALYSDKAIELKGTCDFCGWNHDMNMPAGTVPNACFAYHLGDGHLAAVTTTGDNVTLKGNPDVEGSPAAINDDVANLWYTLADMLGMTQGEVNEVLANADNTSIVNPLNGITYIQGDATINAQIRGTGLLYVTGDVAINGGFQYSGLIYIEGDCTITGSPWIMGSVCTKGTSDYNFNAGTGGVVYSAEAIAQALTSSMPMVTLAWRDL